MRIDAGQHMRMSQQMKLSPRMIQSMEILQLPAMALEERIEQELEANPLLELVEVRPDEDSRDRDRDREADADRAPEEERPLVAHDSDAGESTRDDFNRLSDFSSDHDAETWQTNTSESGEYRPTRVSSDGERDAKMDAMANTAARSAPLTDQLLEQWRFAEVDDEMRRAGEHLITFIDDDGYLRTSFEDIIRQGPRELTIPLLERTLAEIQRRLDPAGVAARDLRECLLLQIDALLQRADDDDEIDGVDVLLIARDLVDRHLHDVEMNRLPRIAQSEGLEIEQVNAALARLRRLDPRPGRQLAPDRPQVIVPDVTIEYDPIHDRYVAGLNRGRQPALRINPQYRTLGKDRDQPRETREFVTRNMHNARWLIDSIQQRNNTLLRVVNAVLDVQRDFLDHGEQHLRPLPMIQVADQLGIHVGTVSRAVSEKYIQTPRGIYPLRMFFSGGTESDSGQEMSWSAVQAKLKEVIDHEDKAAPYSDDQLVEKLKEQGIEIARRTVAKYRNQLNIPPARRRRAY
mgnify:CR=1 FL=1